MHKQALKCFAAASIVLLATSIRADEFQGTATIEFRGSSTLHDFEGTVAAKPFSATYHASEKSGEWRVSAKTSLSVLDMTTRNKKRDNNMFKMLDPKNFELISGSITNATIPSEGSRETPVKVKIRDVELELGAILSDFKRDGDQASCRMDFPVSLKAFGLKPPSVMGIIRVDDTVEVSCIVQGHIEPQTQAN